MKKLILLIGMLTVSHSYAACQDRYYYYKPNLTVSKEKNWQVYDDKGFINSRELSDMQKMVKECGSPAKNGKYNFQAIVNVIVPGNFYQLKNPLFNYPNLRLPHGVDGEKGIYLDIRQRPGFSSLQAQHSGEVRRNGNIGIIQVYLIREGKDDLKTPDWFFSNYRSSYREGYSYTEFK